MTRDLKTDPRELAEELDRLRAAKPLVHNITNTVAATPSANALLAIGAVPVMSSAELEAREFAMAAQALVINLGTLQPATVPAMRIAIAAAQENGRPWVLDPVAHFATSFRTEIAQEMLALRPTLVRGNASEILAFGGAGSGRGTQAGDPVSAAEATARDLARRTGGTVAVSGAVDFLTDGVAAARVSNGHPLMSKVTALGCALSAICGAFLGAGVDPFRASVAAFATFGLAGERAAETAAGPGSLAIHVLDELHLMTSAGLAQGARIESGG
ncbi:MAG: hydroxyethylthiazole kinase [Pseudomonadota bacterium]